jgi:hypothetical protein
MRRPPLKTDGQGQTGTKLLVAMTGKASAAKAAEGDKPVFAYLASLPQPQRSIAERIDALAANTLPSLQRAVKWGMAYYGVGGGWCFSSGAFVGHVKLMFIRGTEIKPEPPVTPIGMGKSTRGVELASVDDLDHHQVASWMKQAAANLLSGGRNDHEKRKTSSGGSLADVERMAPAAASTLVVAKQRKTSKSRTP